MFPCLLTLLLTLFTSSAAEAPWKDFAAKVDDWYRSDEGRRVASNIISWQTPYGTWPKNTDTSDRAFPADAAMLRGTFDNGATVGEMRFLVRAFTATHDPLDQKAFLKGLDGILKAQYPTGGWPQIYPPGEQYHRHITFNDGAMINVMELLREIASLPEYQFVDEAKRDAARQSFDRGVRCILKCQIVVKGKPTVWCAQHDPVDLRPRQGRAYELPSLSGAESARILHLLMSLEKPSPEVIRSVKAGAEWFEGSKIQGIRVTEINEDRVVITDTNAPVLWARFYDIDTNRPIFSGRDGVKKFTLAEIEPERRNNYAWYGHWGKQVLEEYAEWRKKIEPPAK